MNIDMLFLLAEVMLVVFIFVRLAYRYIGKALPDVSKYTGRLSGLVKRVNSQGKPKVRWYGYHLLIYGSTGSGKTTFVEYILQQIVRTMPKATFIVINPHHRKGQWGLKECIGGGRDYESIEQGIAKVLELMNSRYERYYADHKATFDDVFVVVDELPAIIANTSKGTIGNALKQLSSEARKVNIWLVVLSQSKLVRQIGFERASDMLDNFVFIKVNKPTAVYEIEAETFEENYGVVSVNISERIYQNAE